MAELIEKSILSSDSHCEIRQAAEALFDRMHCEDGLSLSLYPKGGSQLEDYFCITSAGAETSDDKNSIHVEHQFGDPELDWTIINKHIAGRQVARVNLFYFSATQAHLETLLHFISRLCRAYNAPAILCIQNPLHTNRVVGLMADLFSNATSQLDAMFTEGGQLLNSRSTSELLKHSGFHEIGRNDITRAPSQAFDDASLMANSVLGKYLRQVTQQASLDAKVDVFVRAYLPVGFPTTVTEAPATTEQAKVPFLSIVTRTQGQRIEALREVLLCLSAQNCMDFELLIMGHKMKPEALTNVQTLIDDLPLWFQEKVRLIQVNEGNRSTPLNYGLQRARGHYIAFLDDDDLVFDNWVEAFRNAEEHGRILHSYAVTQKWSSVTDDKGNTTLAAVGPMGSQYCCDFYFISQLNNNRCPLHSLAFPAFLYRRLGLTFDEMLDTTEDWDFLMRSYFLCGIRDIPEVTCIYRLWVNHENSYALHSDEEWDANRIRIQKRLMNSTLLLDSHAVRDVYRLYGEVKRLEGLAHVSLLAESRLYLDFGEGYSQSTSLELDNELELPYFEYRASGLDESDTPIKAIRWDPQDEGMLFLDYLDISIEYLDGPATRITLPTASTNGAYANGLLGFFKSDPQVTLLEGNHRPVSQIIIRGHISDRVDDEVLQRLIHLASKNASLQESSDFQSHLYLDFGKGYTQAGVLQLHNKQTVPGFEYQVEMREMPPIRAIRWDPQEKGMLFLDYLDVTIEYTDASSTQLTLPMVKSNGVYADGFLGFFLSDPQLVLLENNSHVVSRVVIRGQRRENVTDDVLEKMMSVYVSTTASPRYTTSFLRRIHSLAGRFQRRLLRK